MIGTKPKAPTSLASAVEAIDFEPGNAELARLREEVRNVAAKDDETRQEIQRLANAARDYRGPESDVVAAAILAGRPLAEATKGSTSREQLEAQRDALQSALEPLRLRADALRKEIAEVEGRERAKAYDALAEHVADLALRQKRAAIELVETHAALSAIADATGRSFMPELRTSTAAVKGVLGNDCLLGWQINLPVPPDVREALAMLAEKSGAVQVAPVAIPTRFL
jgi:prefoldin subunit 5